MKTDNASHPRSRSRRDAEFATFWKQAVTNRFHTGAIAPSSRFLAEAMLSVLPPNHPPRRILEVGPGTGPVTRELARRLQPGDQLTLCEINPDFVAQLRQWHGTLPSARQAQIGIVQGDILRHEPPDGGYHHIFCGLPFNNFPLDLIRAMFVHFRRLGLPGATFSYFEYLGIREAKAAIPGRAFDRARDLAELMGGYARRAQTHEFVVWRNIPPARVRHLRAGAL
jgi:phospholipid N-methyltransferase